MGGSTVSGEVSTTLIDDSTATVTSSDMLKKLIWAGGDFNKALFSLRLNTTPRAILQNDAKPGMFSYLATSFLGFEAACESEIRQKLKPHSVRIMPQKVYFTSDVLPSRIDNLKSGTLQQRICVSPKNFRKTPSDFDRFSYTAVRICAWVAEFNDLPPDINALKRLETYASECDWSKPLQSFYLRHPTIQPTDHQFRVTAERRGLEHKGWKSPEAAGSIGSGVVEQFGWKVNLKNFNTEIFIEIDDTLVTIGIVLFSVCLRLYQIDHLILVFVFVSI
jgi:hypothetical protein